MFNEIYSISSQQLSYKTDNSQHIAISRSCKTLCCLYWPLFKNKSSIKQKYQLQAKDVIALKYVEQMHD